MAKKRSWLRLLFVSILAGAGVAALRNRQPAVAPAQSGKAAPVTPPVEAPAIDLAKPQPVFEPVEPVEPEPDSPPVLEASPQLAFVPEAPAAGSPAQSYVPPADLLPGFGGLNQPADPWTPTETMVAAPPELVEDAKASKFSQWSDRTPKRDRIYIYVGAFCVLAAIVATIVVAATL